MGRGQGGACEEARVKTESEAVWPWRGSLPWGLGGAGSAAPRPQIPFSDPARFALGTE